MKNIVAILIKPVIWIKQQFEQPLNQEQLAEPAKDDIRLRLSTINFEIQRIIDIAA